MNELYPLKFEPILADKIWGGEKLKKQFNKEKASNYCGESWEISAYNNSISIVSEGFLKGNSLTELIEIYMDDLVGEKVYSHFGNVFPLLIKFIDANEILSIQVHPDDEVAIPKHNSFGKTEMWYIVEAEPDSELISGFKTEVTKEEYIRHLNSHSLLDILNTEKVSEGDVFFIPPGRVHALGKGIVLVEIQQTSDLTYRIYDFDRKDSEGNPRELHTEDALEVIDFKVYPSYKTDYIKGLNKSVEIGDCQYFTTNLIHLDQPVDKEYHLIDSFVIYICTEGKIEIIWKNDQSAFLSKGETILIPAEIKELQIRPLQESKILEVYIK